jgi:hypothetical protein
MTEATVVVQVSGNCEVAINVKQDIQLSSWGFAYLTGHCQPCGIDLDESSVDGAVAVECPCDFASAVESGVDCVGAASGFTPRDIGEHFDW